MTASADWLEAHLGPVEVVSIALPDAAVPDAWHALLGAVDARQLRILDIEFIRRTDAGAEAIAAGDVPGLQLPDPAGASSGLLDDDDLAAAGDALRPGQLAAVLLVEHLGLLHVLHAFESAGAEVLLDGLLSLDDLEAALAETED